MLTITVHGEHVGKAFVDKLIDCELQSCAFSTIFFKPLHANSPLLVSFANFQEYKTFCTGVSEPSSMISTGSLVFWTMSLTTEEIVRGLSKVGTTTQIRKIMKSPFPFV